ncbi:MAG: hypothetical protein M5U09_09385, partial [Gammaproteobacteria bacterium]|nr:hypothetical protein [Gammaproteobacteria bacterium]
SAFVRLRIAKVNLVWLQDSFTTCLLLACVSGSRAQRPCLGPVYMAIRFQQVLRVVLTVGVHKYNMLSRQ